MEFRRECETAGRVDVGLARILTAINSKMGFLTKCSKLTISLTLFLERSRGSQLVTARLAKKSYLIRIKSHSNFVIQLVKLSFHNIKKLL